MEERAIHISSINREKRGTSRPGDFTIKFNPSLKLDITETRPFKHVDRENANK